jgi:hypothetical protein
MDITGKASSVGRRWLRDQLRSRLPREERSEMCMLPSPTARTTIILDPANEAEALKVAKRIAMKIGRTVTVRDSDGAEIETIFATKH